MKSCYTFWPGENYLCNFEIAHCTLKPRLRRTNAHVIFARLVQDLSHRVRFHMSLTTTVIHHIYHCMSHAPSLLFLSHLSTTSLSTCTPVRPSARPPTGPSMMSTSHGDLPCADPSDVSFGPLAETHSPAGYERKDLTEEDTSFFGQTDVLPQTEHDVVLWFS